MANVLRFLRVGLVNVLGIAVPGLLLLVFFVVGIAIPAAVVGIPLCQEFLHSDKALCVWSVSAAWSGNKSLLVALALVFAYISGYIIRLSTPDDLDKRSAKLVLEKMDREAGKEDYVAAKEDDWPTRLEDEDKYPYFHFKEYLQSRGLDPLAELVAWGPKKVTDASKRSKTHVNMLKLKVLAASADLSAVIESNEAHVRLIFGTWVAITTCWRIVWAGFLVSILGLVATALLGHLDKPLPGLPAASLLIVLSSVLVAMNWARGRIENMFHYQRVRELTHIVGCAYNAEDRRETGKED